MVYFSAGFLFILFLFFYFVPADLLVSAKIRAFHGYCRKTLVLLGIQSGTKQPCFCTDCTVRNQLQNQNFEYIFFNVQTFEYIEFLPSKKVDRIATFPTIKNKRCLISFPGFFFLLEFMFMAFFFFYPFLLTWKMNHKKSMQPFHKFFQMLGIRETDNQPVTTDNYPSVTEESYSK